MGVMKQGNGSTRHQPWPPSTEGDLSLAATEGALEERHKIDVKREIPPGDSGNKELAKDLASFAIDGGRLIVGIDESAGFALTPVDLKGLGDRIDMVVHSRIDEPLDVEITTIRTAADPDRGYLVVEVPVSPRAPHMVDNRYWGRAEKGKFPLGDALVTQLIERRAQWAIEPARLLDESIARDPIARASQKNAHMHIVAIPVPRGDEMMLPVFSGRDWQMDLNRMLIEARKGEGLFSPNIGSATGYFTTTSRGWACANKERDAAGALDPRQENFFIEVEVAENGPIYVRSCRATDYAYQGRKCVIEVAVLGLPHEVVKLSDVLSKAVAFSGSWDFAIAITNLRGAISYMRPQRMHSVMDSPAYDTDEYRTSTRASAQEIRARPGVIVNRLVGRLMRAIGIEQAPELQELLGRPAPAQSGAARP
jgi:hypothetical protein